MKNLKKLFNVGLMFGCFWVLTSVVSFLVEKIQKFYEVDFMSQILILDLSGLIFRLLAEMCVTLTIVLYVYGMLEDYQEAKETNLN